MRGVQELGPKPSRRKHVDKQASAERFREQSQRTHPANVDKTNPGVMRGGIRL